MSEATIDDGYCFACGPLSPDGMHMAFVPDGEQHVRCEIVLPARFQGWKGVAHGGIVMTMLDEAMAHACGRIGERGVTASMELRFRAPVPIGVPLVVRGAVRWKRRAVIAVEGDVSLADGTLLASAEGSFVSRGPLGKERFGIPDAAGDA
ncbi:MAG TPA: PaaI family thioesterase [Candidatus Elarobacter sp.]